GRIITFEQAEIPHARVEMGFDMGQIGLERFAPRAYRRNIGFLVAQDLLDRAFQETYGLTVRTVIGPERRGVTSYRFSSRELLPKFMQVQVLLHHRSYTKEKDDGARREYLENVAKADYASLPGSAYRHPGFSTHALALLVRIVPKVGTLKILSLRAPL